MTQTVVTMVIVSLAYLIGRGAGRAQGRRETLPTVQLVMELNGDPIGGVVIGGIRPGPGWEDVAPPPSSPWSAHNPGHEDLP